MLVDTGAMKIKDKITEQLKTIIEEKKNWSDTRPLLLAKTLYNSCMNECECNSVQQYLWKFRLMKLKRKLIRLIGRI